MTFRGARIKVIVGAEIIILARRVSVRPRERTPTHARTDDDDIVPRAVHARIDRLRDASAAIATVVANAIIIRARRAPRVRVRVRVRRRHAHHARIQRPQPHAPTPRTHAPTHARR